MVDYATFEGVVVEKKEVNVREQQEFIPEPIKASVDLASDTGIVKIVFSRAIKINFDQTNTD